MNKKYFSFLACGMLTAMTLGSCLDSHSLGEIPFPDEEVPTDPDQPSDNQYAEQYRPQVHYTPAKNWINDPNGLVYLDGTYHMFYQYNPSGNEWGNMSWGHATSTDLIHWTEQPVAMTGDDLGAIFSGSCVVDKNNTAGFGANALVAIYTSAGDHQQQSIAYSTDGGKTFEKYAGNPVIPNVEKSDFRDPKVVWNEETQQWIMCLATGYDHTIEFWGSKNLKEWTYLQKFTTTETKCLNGQWECPDLLEMDYNGTKKWVLIVSVNPGGPTNVGSGTMYFVGSFNGKKFRDEKLGYPLWLDNGADNYAGVTFSNVEGRHILLGWMNNWAYSGDSPVKPWRSAMTLPRELTLKEVDGSPLLCSTVVKELDQIAGEWTALSDAEFAEGAAYEVEVEVSLQGKSEIVIGNAAGEHLDYTVYGDTKKIDCHRKATSGKTDFNDSFVIPHMMAPLNTTADKVTLRFIIDQSSVEMFTADGASAHTTLVYPTKIYNSIKVDGKAATGRVRILNSIWKK